MRVKTLNESMLTDESIALAQVVEDDFTPDTIIAIKTGGVFVAQPLFSYLKEKNTTLVYTEISLSRESTKVKKAFNVSTVLKRLPYFILDILRKLEVSYFEYSKDKTYNSAKESKVSLDETLLKTLSHSKKLLLVDDAIDTGATLLAIKNVLEKKNNEVEIKTAVLTSTHKHSYIEADYKLYSRVLLRCPWAEDYRGV